MRSPPSGQAVPVGPPVRPGRRRSDRAPPIAPGRSRQAPPHSACRPAIHHATDRRSRSVEEVNSAATVFASSLPSSIWSRAIRSGSANAPGSCCSASFLVADRSPISISCIGERMFQHSVALLADGFEQGRHRCRITDPAQRLGSGPAIGSRFALQQLQHLFPRLAIAANADRVQGRLPDGFIPVSQRLADNSACTVMVDPGGGPGRRQVFLASQQALASRRCSSNGMPRPLVQRAVWMASGLRTAGRPSLSNFPNSFVVILDQSSFKPRGSAARGASLRRIR